MVGVRPVLVRCVRTLAGRLLWKRNKCKTQIMKKPIQVKPKKRRGRPATGKDPFVGIRLPKSLIAEVEAWATSHEVASRSAAIRMLLEIALRKGK